MLRYYYSLCRREAAEWMINMKLKELISGLDVLELTADPETDISGISYDSRKTRPGDLFVAIKGFESDGHRFIPKAVEMGARVVLCQDVPEACNVPYVRVEDCRYALAVVSREFFGDPASGMCMIGITGTSGKTSTSHIIKHMLEDKLRAKVGLIGTNGNMIGDTLIHTEHTTPESLELQQLFRRMADEGCTHVVMEVSSHSLALNRVAGIAYDVAVFTNLSQDHLDFHHTMEEYAAAKRLLFSRCRYGCFNLDDRWAEFMMDGAGCRIYTFSEDKPDADLHAENVSLSATGVEFTAVEQGSSTRTRLGIPGAFSVYNALSVMAVGRCLGIPLCDCADSLSTAKGVKGRMEVVPTDGDYSILIDYSHKPDALEKVLKSLRPVTRGRLICLFGCGGDRDRLKRPIMGSIAADNSDLVIITSDNPRTEEPQTIIDEILVGLENRTTEHKTICDRTEAIGWAIDNALPGDVILLAGKGHEDYQVIGHEKHHMDEREIVAEHLEKRKHRI